MPLPSPQGALSIEADRRMIECLSLVARHLKNKVTHGGSGIQDHLHLALGTTPNPPVPLTHQLWFGAMGSLMTFFT